MLAVKGSPYLVNIRALEVNDDVPEVRTIQAVVPRRHWSSRVSDREATIVRDVLALAVGADGAPCADENEGADAMRAAPTVVACWTVRPVACTISTGMIHR